MADYTAFEEAGSALVELLRERMTPEPLDNRESIALCSPHASENDRLTLWLYQIEEENQNMTSGYRTEGRDVQRIPPAQFSLRFLATAHSKAPVQMREADQYRVMGALMQVVRDNPVIPAEMLRGSLAEEGAAIHVSVERLPTEALLKIWNNTAKEYKLSVSLLVTGISIRSKRARRVPRVTEVEIGTAQKPRLGDEGGRR